MVDHSAQQVTRQLGVLIAALGEEQEKFWSRLIRQALDEVIDGPRTGRWEVDRLEKTEKTYIGTKIEILVRSELGVPKGVRADLIIDGIEVDVKWSLDGNWMIGPENVEQVCLLLTAPQSTSRFSVGVVRAADAALTRGGNRDGKRQLSGRAKQEDISWLVRQGALPQNLLATLEPSVREYILEGTSAQDRVCRLVNSLPEVPIPRQIIETVAGNKMDPMRRLRRDKYRKNSLGDMVLLHTSQGKRTLLALGYSDLPKDHWIAVPQARLDALGMTPE